MVQMRPPVAAPALINNEIQYTTTFGSILNAIMQGVPAKLLAVITEKPPCSIVARPGIKSVAELRGKKLAAQPRVLCDRIAAEAILESKGVDLKDVQFVTISGDLPVRMSVLTSGLADAVCLLPPGPVLLERDSYGSSPGPNDVKVGSPKMGLSASNQRLAERRSEVKRVIRALVRRLRFVRDRREDAGAIWRSGSGKSLTSLPSPTTWFCRVSVATVVSATSRCRPSSTCACRPSVCQSQRHSINYATFRRARSAKE